LAPPSHEQGTREGHEHDAAFPSSNRTGPFFFSLTFFSQLDPSDFPNHSATSKEFMQIL
jgi:hypothetical protein